MAESIGDGRFEAGLESLDGAVEMVMSHAAPHTTPLYFAEDFRRPESSPADLADSPYYGRPVSLGWPVCAVAPVVSKAAILPELQKLEWVRPIFKRMMLLSHRDDALLLDAREQRRILLAEDVRMHRIFMSLADGAHVAYPGMEGMVEAGDPRTAPRYTIAAHKTGIHWGAPYSGDHGALVLPCSTSLYDRRGEFRGVAGFEVHLEHLVEDLLDLPEIPALEDALLVNSEGLVLVGKSRDAERATGGTGAHAVEPLAYPEIAGAIRSGEKGYRETSDGNPRLVAFFPVSAVGWHYVAIADREALLAEGGRDP